MFKANKLLKVVSVILIVLGVFSLISTLLTKTMMSKIEGMEGVDVAALTAQITPTLIIISILISFVYLVCGILPLLGKGYKVALVGIGLILAYQVYSTITTAMATGFSFMSISGYIVPLLYAWGLYQSKE